MERMVPEVEYLVDKGYFSRAETRSVVQTRMDFEYKLKAKVPEKESYWRSVQLTREGRCLTSSTSYLLTMASMQVHCLREEPGRAACAKEGGCSLAADRCQPGGGHPQTRPLCVRAGHPQVQGRAALLARLAGLV